MPIPYRNQTNRKDGEIMAKSIITQDGIIVNYNNLLAVFVDL